jgi:low affinity Fe/Cu permease
VGLARGDRELAEAPRLSLYASKSFSDECWAWLSRPLAVAAVGVFITLWLIFDWESFNWQAVASVATLLMTLFIQRSEHRDTQAIHAKLDELLRAQGEGKNHLATLDDKEPEQIEAFRKQARTKVD